MENETLEEMAEEMRQDRKRSTATERSKPEMKRLNINLPSTLLEELQNLADQTGKSMTEVVRTALGLVHIAYTQTGPDRRLTISDDNGKPLKEIVVPR